MMSTFILLLLSCSLHAAALRSAGTSALVSVAVADGSMNGMDSSYEEAEVSDRSFWAAQWRALENDLLRLEGMLSAADHRSGLLQVAAKAEPTQQSKVKERLDAVLSGAPNSQGKAESLTKGSDAELGEMLQMMSSMYDTQHKRTAVLHKRDEFSKKRFTNQQTQYQDELKRLAAGYRQRKSPAELAAYRSKMEGLKDAFRHFQKLRDQNLKEFQNAMALTNGVMTHEREMIDLMVKAKEKQPPVTEQSLKAGKAGVESLHRRTQALVGYCQHALKSVREEIRKIEPKEPSASTGRK